MEDKMDAGKEETGRKKWKEEKRKRRRPGGRQGGEDAPEGLFELKE